MACATQPAVRCAVVPRMRIRRLACSMTARMYWRCAVRVTVSMKSQASSFSAWERRKSAQVVMPRWGAGSMPSALRISQTVEGATLQRAQHHAEQARRRYLAVDPTNRLVADTLEADWNNTLRELAEATDVYERAKATAATLTDIQRQRITALAADFPTLWNDPATPLRERKRMVRLLIEDVTIRRDKAITVHIRLKGGQHHSLTLPLPLAAWQLRQTPPHVVAAINELLDEHTDSQIAAILTSRNIVSGTGQPLYGRLIGQIRHHYQLRSHTQRLRDTGRSPSPRSATGWASHPTPSKPGATEDSSPAASPTTKASTSTKCPTATCPGRAPAAHPAAPAPPKTHPDQPQGAQYEAISFARGARGGIFTTSMPAAVNTASNAAVNFASRSRIRYRNHGACSSRSISRLRACCVTQAPVG
jgi:hypothetical protein